MITTAQELATLVGAAYKQDATAMQAPNGRVVMVDGRYRATLNGEGFTCHVNQIGTSWCVQTNYRSGHVIGYGRTMLEAAQDAITRHNELSAMQAERETPDDDAVFLRALAGTFIASSRNEFSSRLRAIAARLEAGR